MIIVMSDGINPFFSVHGLSSAGFQFRLFSSSPSFCPTHQNILVSVVFRQEIGSQQNHYINHGIGKPYGGSKTVLGV